MQNLNVWQIKGKSRLNFILLSLMILLSSSFVYAKNDQNYTQWKNQQTEKDAELKSIQNADHYLARPSLVPVSQTTSRTSAKKATKQNELVGKVNINQANIQQLQQLSGIGQVKAQAIIEYRQSHGKFKMIEDLQKVKGIGPKLLEKNKMQVVL